MTGDTTCPLCGGALQRDAPAGNCPSCLLRHVLPEAEPVPPFVRFFADYELIEEIAHGGMGIVYRARQISLNRPVALKMILAGHLATPSLVRRFRAEAEAAARLDHPNIVPIYEIGEHEGQHYFSMKLVEGQNLARSLHDAKGRLARTDQKGSPISPAQAVRLLTQIARAVQHAHERGILHRDLKPTNIVIDAQGEPHVSDFGLAKILEDNLDLTQSLAVLGTPAYMAPEQANGQSKQLTTAADVYSLGAILYELLTGRPPFRGETALATMRQVAEQEPPRPSALNPRLDRTLETICLKCLEKNPLQRYGTAEALAEDLDRFARGEPVQARPVSQPERFWRWCRRKPALAGALAALFVAVLAGFAGISWQWQRAESHAAREAGQRAQAQQLATRLTLDKAEVLFGQDRAADALAFVARVLRESPTNRVVAERAVSALGQRNFCVPVAALRHGGEVASVSFSPNGRRVLTASQDKTARLWDGTTGEKLFELKPDGGVESARFSPDGSLVVTAARDGTAQIWNALTGERIGPALKHGGAVQHAEFSLAGDRVVTASADFTARVWDARTGRPFTAPLVHGSNVVEAHFSPDGQRVVTSARDKIFRVWAVESGRLVIEGIRHRWDSDRVQFTPDGTRILVAGTDLFDAATGKSLGRRFQLHTPRIYSAEFSPDGHKAITASADSTARLWDFESGVPVAEPLWHDSRVYSAEFSPDGSSVVTCGKDRVVRVWDARSGRALTEPLWHDSEVRSAHFSADGHRLVTQPDGNVAWLWDVRQLQPLTPTFQHAEAVRAAHFSRDGQRVLTASWDNTAKLWDVRTGALLIKPFQHGGWLSSARFSPDERRIVTASHDHTARVWDAETGASVARLVHRGDVSDAEFSPDNQSVLTASEDGTAQVWDAGNGQSRLALKHAGPVNAAHFSPDGQRIVTASSDNSARIWDASSGSELISLRHEQPVQSARFTPDGRHVVTVGWDHSARVWDARTGKQIASVQHEDEFDVFSPQFSPEGARVATASRNSARLWNLLTGQALTEPLTHSERVTSVQFDPGGTRVVTTSKDHTARLWDAATALPLGEAFLHSNGVISAEFSRDGRWLITASYDGLARVWEVPQFPDTVPAWLSGLVEAVGGKRFDARNFSEAASLEELFRLRSEIIAAPVTNSYARWARWFFSDNATRLVSPGSSITFSNYVEQRLRDNTVESLRVAARLTPANGLVFSRLAMLLFNQTNRDAGTVRETEWFARHAVEVSPEEAETWLTRAKMLELDGKLREGLDVLRKAGLRLPQNPAVWNAQGTLLLRTNRLDEAYQAFSKAIDLTEHGTEFINVRNRALQNRSDVLRRLGRADEAHVDFLRGKGIPPRGSLARPDLVDLTRHYNAGLGQNWRGLYKNDDLASLPLGLQKFGEVEYDVRGVVQLSGQWLKRQGRKFRADVKGIQVDATCRQLHFLHAAGYVPGGTNGAEIARYVVHFANDKEENIPIIFGRDVLRHWVGSVPVNSSDGPVVAWRGKASPTNAPAAGLSPALYQTTWKNPWPEVAIKSLDFVSTMTEVDAFLIAITAERENEH